MLWLSLVVTNEKRLPSTLADVSNHTPNTTSTLLLLQHL